MDTEAVVRPFGNCLLRTYFDVIHSSYPLLDPARISSNPESRDPLIVAMYALASPFTRGVGNVNASLHSFLFQA